MKYDMLDKESVKRVLDTFEAHSLFINKKYEAFKSKDNYWSSDRDRFVGRFFKKYLGKFFILIDKEVIGYYDEYNDTGFSAVLTRYPSIHASIMSISTIIGASGLPGQSKSSCTYLVSVPSIL